MVVQMACQEMSRCSSNLTQASSPKAILIPNNRWEVYPQCREVDQWWCQPRCSSQVWTWGIWECNFQEWQLQCQMASIQCNMELSPRYNSQWTNSNLECIHHSHRVSRSSSKRLKMWQTFMFNKQHLCKSLQGFSGTLLNMVNFAKLTTVGSKLIRFVMTIKAV